MAFDALVIESADFVFLAIWVNDVSAFRTASLTSGFAVGNVVFIIVDVTCFVVSNVASFGAAFIAPSTIVWATSAFASALICGNRILLFQLVFVQPFLV